MPQPYRPLAGAAVGSPRPPAFALVHVLVQNGGADGYPWHWFSPSLQSGSVEEEQVVDLRYGIGALPRTPLLPRRSRESPVCFGLHDPKGLIMRVAVGVEQWVLIFTG